MLKEPKTTPRRPHLRRRPVIVFRWSAFGEGEVWELNCSEKENVNRTWMPQPAADPLSCAPVAFVEPFLLWWIMNVEKVCRVRGSRASRTPSSLPAMAAGRERGDGDELLPVY